MYCGNCLRDNTLVTALRKLGHDGLMVPLYLPLTLDEPDQSANTPIFFGGINVFLDNQWAAFSKAPSLLRRVLSARPVLRLAAGRAAKTRPGEVGDLTLSMLRGEQGRQARDLEELVSWLEKQPSPDVIILSNALLIGVARALKKRLGSRLVCQLGGEDSFLDGLPGTHREICWRTIAERMAEVDVILAPTDYFANLMSNRLGISRSRISIVPTGINLEGYEEPAPRHNPPVLGFFTRMSREKGVNLVVQAFVQLRRSGRLPKLRLKVGGSCSPADEAVVQGLRGDLSAADLSRDVTWHPNLNRPEKINFLRSLSVFSAPASYGEAFGLYVIEAMAAGVPVIEPDTAAFPEIIHATGGGLLCKPGDVNSLADRIAELVENPDRASALGKEGRRTVFEKYSASAMAQVISEACNA
jgi:glycosyltransferase involved in cell wall biosynthesis